MTMYFEFKIMEMFKKHYGQHTRRGLPLDYDLAPMEGLQHHQSESISALLARLTRGDTTVLVDVLDDEDYPFDSHVDSFDVMDRMNEMSERLSQEQTNGNSESLASEAAEQPLGNAQAADDKPGDSEIAP